MTTHTCGRIGLNSVGDCAHRCAIIIYESNTKRAVCLSPDGFVTVESVSTSIPDEQVGIYDQSLPEYVLWGYIESDLVFAQGKRGIKGGRDKRRYVSTKTRKAA